MSGDTTQMQSRQACVQADVSVLALVVDADREKKRGKGRIFDKKTGLWLDYWDFRMKREEDDARPRYGLPVSNACHAPDRCEIYRCCLVLTSTRSECKKSNFLQNK